jgi:S1-C subfamily serine protease
MKTKILLLILSATLTLSLIACSDDDGSQDSSGEEGGASASPEAAPSTSNASGTGSLPAGLSGVVDEVRPSVVSILRDGGEGSGVIWDDQGHVITNNHVVEGASQVQVVLTSGERLPATIVGTDPLTDLAVLEVERTDLPEATFVDELPPVGEFVLAIGNPLGFENSVTFGIVSGHHRAIPSGGTTPALVDLLQTDAAISPGNSGGALVDTTGEVVGINVAYIPPQESAVALGFAIPATTVVDVVEQLLEDGTVEHAFLGIEPRPVTPAVASQLGLGVDEGVFVFGLSPGGAAEEAGIEPGDVITEFDGKEVTSIEDLYAALRSTAPNQTVDVTVLRQGSEQTLEVTLQDRPAE